MLQAEEVPDLVARTTTSTTWWPQASYSPPLLSSPLPSLLCPLLFSSLGPLLCTCSSGRPASVGLYRMLPVPLLSPSDRRAGSQQSPLSRPQLHLYRHLPSLRSARETGDGKKSPHTHIHTHKEAQTIWLDGCWHPAGAQ